MSDAESKKLLSGKTYVIEYSCPNAFKELHTGHLYNTIAGDILARLIEQSGAVTHRTSFGGDVGLHVAKCLWGIITKLGGEFPEKLESDVSTDPLERANWISDCYVLGAGAYEEDEAAKVRIVALNKAVYEIHDNQERETPLAQIYWTCRQWSFDYFKAFYELIQVDQMRYYPESETTKRGLNEAQKQLKNGNLEESDGAVVFKGDESKNLHTRVFITSKGLPTYETKDVGVILAEQEEYAFDHRVLITGNDQAEYMKVVFAAMDVFQPGIAQKMTHLTNGTVRFGDGKKMSSRLGNVSRAVDVVAAVHERVGKIEQGNDVLQNHITLGAIKYEFAKYRLGGDVAFDIEESVSLKGNSGPYLQYAHARACSILQKSSSPLTSQPSTLSLDSAERSLLRKIGEYAEVVEQATTDLMPHHICTYLYELAQTFNRFYENNRVLDDPREASRLQLVGLYAKTLKSGLTLLGIHAPEKM
jgi:arginyl-tRNA synthetase